MHRPPRNFLSRLVRYLLSTAAIAAAVAVAIGVPLNSIASMPSTATATPSRAFTGLGRPLAQNSDSDADEDNGVSSDQIEQYVAVYRDMQRDRSLAVESAAAKENLTISQFRELEQKIERNDVAREHVRTELQAAANPSPSAASTAVPSKN